MPLTLNQMLKMLTLKQQTKSMQVCMFDFNPVA